MTATGNAQTAKGKSEPKPAKRRYPIYIYPARNPLYDQFAKKYQPTGRQAVIRKLLVEAYAEARKDMDAWLAEVERHGESVPFPILDLTDSTTRTSKRYDVYLRTDDPDHVQLIEYLDSLSADNRQRFLRLAFITAMRMPDIDDLTRGL